MLFSEGGYLLPEILLDRGILSELIFRVKDLLVDLPHADASRTTATAGGHHPLNCSRLGEVSRGATDTGYQFLGPCASQRSSPSLEPFENRVGFLNPLHSSGNSSSWLRATSSRFSLPYMSEAMLSPCALSPVLID